MTLGQVLASFNLVLAVGIVLMVGLVVHALTRRIDHALTRHDPTQVKVDAVTTRLLHRAWTHIRLAMLVALLFSLVGLNTATGRLLAVFGNQDFLPVTQAVAAAGRAVIFIILAAWAAWVVEPVYRGHHRRLDRFIDTTLHLRRGH